MVVFPIDVGVTKPEFPPIDAVPSELNTEPKPALLPVCHMQHVI